MTRARASQLQACRAFGSALSDGRRLGFPGRGKVIPPEIPSVIFLRLLNSRVCPVSLLVRRGGGGETNPLTSG
jgi:hypothetical protein